MTIPAVILHADAPSARFRVGGIPLTVRHLKELYRVGVREFYLDGLAHPPPESWRSAVPDDILLQPLPRTSDRMPQRLRAALPPSQDVLLVRGDCLIDPRLLAELVSTTSPHWLPATPDRPDTLPAAARLTPERLAIWATDGLRPWLHHSPRLAIASLDTYSPSHRGPVPFYIETIRTPADAAAATRTLIRAAQKRALDLPALWLHPHIENRLVYWLCGTRITPNQITVLTTLLGALTAVLFLNGWLRLGILLGYAVAILDGVDGKLARTKLQTSRFGEFEHVFDFLVEHAWYLTITMALVRTTGRQTLWWFGGGLMVCDFLDNMLYYLGQVALGRQLDELGRFDRRFRLIGGRRNLYAWIFLIGFWAGFPVGALAAACLWAAITIGVHGVRLGYHVYRRRRQIPASPSWGRS